MSQPINVSFNPVDCWKRGDFRDFIALLQQVGNIHLYIIAYDELSENTTYISSVGSNLNLESSRIITENTLSDMNTHFTDNNIHIHLDTNNEVLTEITQDTTVTTSPILVTYKVNYTPDPTYINEFNRVLTTLI